MPEYAETVRGTKPDKYRLNNQSTRFTGINKKANNVHLVMDEGEILQTTDYDHAMDRFEIIQWLHSMHVYQTISQATIPGKF